MIKIVIHLKGLEIAEVLTCIRMNFGNNASTIVPQEVTAVREMMDPRYKAGI